MAKIKAVVPHVIVTRMFTETRSIESYLRLLAFSTLVPAFAFSAYLLWNFANFERRLYERQLQQTATDLANDIDRDVDGLIVKLSTLATSRALRRVDLAEFHAQAIEALPERDTNLVVLDVSLQQLANTLVPFGTPLPKTGDPDTAQRAIATIKPQLSDLFTGAVAGNLRLNVVVPVVQQGEARFVLLLSFFPERIVRIMQGQVLPSGWVTSLADRNGKVIARSAQNERFVGTTLPAAFLNIAESAILPAKDIDGTEVLRAVAPTKGGWMVVATVQQSLIAAAARAAVRDALIGGLVLLLLSLACGYAIGRQLRRPVESLAKQAAALGHGEMTASIETPIREINVVTAALSAAGAGLRERERQRDMAEAALQKLNLGLEAQVSERTRELTAINERLNAEIDHRKGAEQQLAQAIKHEAVGQLTGGIAHDFNNMLAIILGCLRMLQRRLTTSDGDIKRYISGALEGAERATQLTRRLLAFSRQQPLSPEPLDGNKLVASMSELLRRTIPESIVIETVLAGGLWRIHADPTQLESALLNLAINARDAMPEGGKLTIETANAHLDEGYAREHVDVASGQYVMLAVTDTGSGMSAEVAARAFDPFFTTKAPAQGTGLGLSQVYGFIKQSGGHVKIYSELGQGTTVKAYLPRFSGTAAVIVDRENALSEAAPRAAHGELVLVVEDEEKVRHLTVDMLRELGYRTLAADGASAALDLLGAHRDVSLLFTDVVMPGMNGRRLADEALRRFPRLKVLFTTGYTRNAIVHNNVLDAEVHLLAKPFTLEALAHKVRELLRTGNPG